MKFLGAGEASPASDSAGGDRIRRWVPRLLTDGSPPGFLYHGRAGLDAGRSQRDGRVVFPGAGQHDDGDDQPEPFDDHQDDVDGVEVSPVTFLLTVMYHITPAAMRKMLMPLAMTLWSLSCPPRLGGGGRMNWVAI